MGRRRKGEPPAYLEHKSSGLAYCFIDGANHYLGRYGSEDSRREYRRVVQHWERTHPDQNADLQPSKSPTIPQLVAAFLVHAKKHYRRQDGSPTKESAGFRNNLRVLLAPPYVDLLVDEFKPSHLKAVRSAWVKRDLARETVNKQVGRICRMFTWGVGEEMVSAPTAFALHAVPGLESGRTEARDNEDVAPVSEDDLARTLAALPPVLKAMVQVQYFCGARPGEVCRMRGDEIHRESFTVGRRTYTLPAGVLAFVPGQHKTRHKGKTVVYCLGPRAQEVLASFLASAGDGFLFSPRARVESLRAEMRAARKTPVQPSQTDRRASHPKKRPGECYQETSYQHAIAKVIERLNAERKAKEPAIEAWSPNQLRHNFVTRVDKEFGIQVASTAVGHTRINTTEIYLEKGLEEAAAAATRLG